MPDYGHELLFGTFITPVVEPAMQAVELAVVAERAGLDLVMLQDQFFQMAFLDPWTVLSYVAARTSRIRLSTNLFTLPLYHPVGLARSAATLDRLSGGRFEMAIGEQAVWNAISITGGRHLTPREFITALDDAIQMMRMVWVTGQIGAVRAEGTHQIGIWIGAYKQGLLKLTGRVADGWLPSLNYLPRGVGDLTRMNKLIDEGAASARRAPAAVQRLLTISGQFTPSGTSLLVGPPQQWAEELASLALQHGISGFILAADSVNTIERFAAEVAPATRQLVAAARAG